VRISCCIVVDGRVLLFFFDYTGAGTALPVPGPVLFWWKLIKSTQQNGQKWKSLVCHVCRQLHTGITYVDNFFLVLWSCTKWKILSQDKIFIRGMQIIPFPPQKNRLCDAPKLEKSANIYVRWQFLIFGGHTEFIGLQRVKAETDIFLNFKIFWNSYWLNSLMNLLSSLFGVPKNYHCHQWLSY